MSNQFSKEKDIFVEAEGISDPAERQQFLDRACGGDENLRDRIDKLLSAHIENEGFIPVDPNEQTKFSLETAPREGEGSIIGRYKLLQNIGEGGCGVVYMAEQQTPVVRRVALKIIKLGMDTKQVIARFEAERQALAMMDHPNISKVLDAGATDNGRPFFVMELVRGVRITEFCDQQNLDTKERLKLFMDVCSAIQHAHQKGVIHRDIKPSNILVTMHDHKSVPKIIDFGIAKATQQRLTDKTLFTQFHQFIGTPAYMSPEQAQMSGLDVDTRTDIYSLGVLLYELLTGRTPLDAKELTKADYDEMRRRIRDEEPIYPSTQLSSMNPAELTTTATRRNTEPARLNRIMRGELDWIVMKALEKNRKRRYETATELALDVQRYLNLEPVKAAAPSSLYRFRKFARRNQAALITAAIILILLTVGSVVSTGLAIKATIAQRNADALAKNVGDFKIEHALKASINTANVRYFDGLGDYIDYHYVPDDKSHSSVSKTLEYAYNDWCISQIASKAGRSEIMNQYSKRSEYYKNVFDSNSGFMRPKLSDGSFRANFDPMDTHGQGFIEGNAWNYGLYVPQDLPYMIDLMGGKKQFRYHLDSLFAMEIADKYIDKHEDITRDGIIGNYVHGNEPGHHIPYLYNWTDKPYKTQERVRTIMKAMYGPAEDGLCGNDDAGQMSAWYVFSAIGFYPVTPGSDEYDLGSPLIKNAKLELANQKTLNVVVENQSPQNIYVQEVSINGKLIVGTKLKHKDIMNGGTLLFKMDRTPKKP